MDELTTEEQEILEVFKELLGEVGALRYFCFFDEYKNVADGFVVSKENGEWVVYGYDRNCKSTRNTYADLYSLCVSMFGALDKGSTDYCIAVFPSLVEEALNESKGHGAK